jgi:hypothetical protein
MQLNAGYLGALERVNIQIFVYGEKLEQFLISYTTLACFKKQAKLGGRCRSRTYLIPGLQSSA